MCPMESKCSWLQCAKFNFQLNMFAGLACWGGGPNLSGLEYVCRRGVRVGRGGSFLNLICLRALRAGAVGRIFLDLNMFAGVA